MSGGDMDIPFNIIDFLDRAELVYGDRVGIMDEPDQPAGTWGDLTWRDVAALKLSADRSKMPAFPITPSMSSRCHTSLSTSPIRAE